MNEALPPLRLKKNEERRLRAGHLWVYSNEVDTAVTPLQSLQAGEQVQVVSQAGKPLGNAYVNPHSLISARLFSRDPQRRLGRSLLVHRLNVALSLRQRLFERPFYRLVYGESDLLPGLVIDRFDDVCVVQITTAGMEQVRDEIVAALERVVSPAGILIRADSAIRELEGLDSYQQVIGEVPEQLMVEEAGLRFSVTPRAGQKTGWFYDQRVNRSRLRAYVAGMRVLDVFSYVGAWGLQALAAGAAQLTCVDSSAAAIERIHYNASLNGFDGRLVTQQGDAFAVMERLRAQHEKFDVVIVDPPAFVKRKKDYKAGRHAYQRLNRLAIQLLGRDGILVSASCSWHFAETDLLTVLQQNARHLDRSLQLLERGHQAPDHPVHPAIPETDYLKALFCRVLPAA